MIDTNKAVEILDGFQKKLQSQGDQQSTDELEKIKIMLESPLFQQLLVIQQSIRDLNAKLHSSSLEEVEDFEFAPNGELIFASKDGGYVDTEQEREYINTQADMNFSGPVIPDNDFDAEENRERIINAINCSKFAQNDEDFVSTIETLAQGREVEVVDLVKPDRGGLGFSVVGLKSENRGELGIFIQEIQPNGVAKRYSDITHLSTHLFNDSFVQSFI